MYVTKLAKSITRLVDMYRLYIGLVKVFGKGTGAFYFKPNAKKFSFDKCPVGINTLNEILPDMCKAGGVKVRPVCLMPMLIAN